MFDPTIFPLSYAAGYGSTGTVRENDFSGWLQADWDTTLGGMGFRGDIGARYILTHMKTTGWSLIGSAGTLTP